MSRIREHLARCKVTCPFSILLLYQKRVVLGTAGIKFNKDRTTHDYVSENCIMGKRLL